MEERNFNLELMQIRRKISADNEEKYTYAFKVGIAGEEFFAEVDEEKLERFEWVKLATHGRAMFYEKKSLDERFYQLVHFEIERKLGSVPISKMYVQNGWKNMDGVWRYVEGTGAIGPNCTNVYGNAEQKLLTSKGMLEMHAAIEFCEMRHIIRDERKSEFLMAVVCGSVLETLMEEVGYPIRFVTAIVGTTNSMKTSCAKVFSQFLNGGNDVEITFASTKGGLETYVPKYSDAILLVDDFMPADSKAEMNYQTLKLKSLLRMYGDRVPTSRMAGDSTSCRPLNEVHGTCLITGEILPGIRSSQTRVLQISLKPGEVDTEYLSYFQKYPLTLPTFLRGFIAYVAGNIDNSFRILKDQTEFYRKATNFSIPRYREAAGQLQAVVELVYEYLGTLGLDYGKFCEEWAASIYSIIEENDQNLEDENYEKMLLDVLFEELNECGGPCALEELTAWGANKIYADSDCVYISQNKYHLLYKKYCQKHGKPEYLSKRDIVKKLVDAGVVLTEVDSDGCVRSSRKLCQSQGNRQRFLYMSKQSIGRVTGIYL